MKNRISIILTTIFLFGLLLFLVHANLSKPRVFILHSYAEDYSWVTDINKGLLRILEKSPYSLRWHYMDTKRHPSKEYILKTSNIAIKMIKKWNPDILIAIDDNAQEFVATHFIDHPKTKILFSGVNAEVTKYNYDKANNVTGILERIPFSSFRDIFHQVLPKGKNRIVHISDNSITSKLIHEELENVRWSPLKLVKSFRCDTFAEWKDAIENAHKLGNILLVTHYHTIRDKNGKIIKPSKIIEWTDKNTKIPLIGCWGFFVEDGGMMAIAVSPFEQGEAVGRMATKIIEKQVSPKDIEVETGRQFVVYIRKKSVEKRELKLPRLLEAFAKATNNYYED